MRKMVRQRHRKETLLYVRDCTLYKCFPDRICKSFRANFKARRFMTWVCSWQCICALKGGVATLWFGHWHHADCSLKKYWWDAKDKADRAMASHTRDFASLKSVMKLLRVDSMDMKCLKFFSSTAYHESDQRSSHFCTYSGARNQRKND